MATLADLRSQVQTYTGAGSTVLPDATCDVFINGAIALCYSAHQWRSQETVSSNQTYAANTASIALPTDFVAEKAIYLLTSSSTPSSYYQYVDKIARDAWFQGSPASTTTDQEFPQVADPAPLTSSAFLYAIWGQVLYLLPTPSTAQTVVLDYWKTLADLSGGTDTNLFTTRYPILVRSGALAEAYEYLHEDERAAVWRQRFEGYLARAILDDKTLAMSGGSYTRGV